MNRPTCERCDGHSELCCAKCAPWWTAQIAMLPKKTLDLAIKDDYHAHTASMRLQNVADRLARDPALLSELAMPELQHLVVASLRDMAGQIGEPS